MRAHDGDLLEELPPPEPPELGAVLDAELARLTPRAPRRPWRDLAVVLAGGLATATALLALMRVRKDLLELPRLWLVLIALGWLAGFVIPAYLALVPPAGHMVARWRAAAVASAISALSFVAVGFLIQPHGPSSSMRTESVLHGHACLELGLGAALVPVLLAALAVRGAFPVGSRWAAAAIGAAGGAVGGLLLHFHCSLADPWHVGVMHGLVVVVAAAISALLVPRATDRAFRDS